MAVVPDIAALDESEATFRRAFEHAPGGIGLATLEQLRWSEVNPALCALLGYDRYELLGVSLQALAEPADLEALRQLREGAISVYETDKRYLHADGHVIWVTLLISLLHDAPRAPRYLIAQIIDITTRKAAEEAMAFSERRQADAQALGGVGSWVWDLSTDVVTWSDQLCLIAGFRAGENPTTLEAFMALVHEEDRTPLAHAVDYTREAGVSESEYRLVRPDGEIRWVRGRGRTVYDAGGRAVRMAGTLQDITERVDSQHALRDAEERFRRSFDEAPIGMALVSLEGRFTKVNDSLCAILGYPQPRLTELRFQDITHAEDLGADEEFVRQMIAGERATYQMHKRYLHADGHTVWSQLNVSLARDEAGEPMYFISQIQDITDRKLIEKRLQDMARRDHLTGLYNRRGFEEELERELANARRFGRRGALLMLDLDGFKTVNDTLGHRAGDEMLSGIARMLEVQLRKTDILGRLGGDEFAVVLTEVSEEHARTVVATLEERFASEAQHGQRVHTTASIGVVMFDGTLGVEDLLAQADEAMYAQKRAAQV